MDLVLLVPALAGSAWLARRWRPALALQGGALLYATYTFTVYAFGVRFNRLFLLYCAALGLAVLGSVRTAVALARAPVLGPRAPVRLAGGFLTFVGVAFLALWLAEDLPAILAGTHPASLDQAGLGTNPVHVLDYSLMLPALALGGVSLWRRRPFGLTFGPVALAFAVLMDLTIAAIQVATPGAGFAVATPMLALAVVSGALLVALLKPARDDAAIGPNGS